jgi:hypothetical protein
VSGVELRVEGRAAAAAVRPQLAASHAGLSLGQMAKLVGERWQALSAESRRPFEVMAVDDRARYVAEVEAARTEYAVKRAAVEEAERRAAEAASADHARRAMAIRAYKPVKLSRVQQRMLGIEDMRDYVEEEEEKRRRQAAPKPPRRGRAQSTAGSGAGEGAPPSRAPKARAKRKVAEWKGIYQPISRNVYLCAKQKVDESDYQSCECEVDSPRGLSCYNDSCVNRAMYWECKKDCAAGDGCRNQRFQRKQYAKIVPFSTAQKGFGLRADELIAHGAFVIEYVGEVLGVQESEARVRQYKEAGKCLYLHMLNDRQVIDAGQKGNFARFINHCCEPNCTTVRWVVNGQDRIGIFALRKIEPGEEITIDYGWSPSQVGDLKCYCGAPSCTGYIGEKAFYDSSRQGNLHGVARASQLKAIDDSEQGIWSKDDHCFVCRQKGTLLCCDVPNCAKVYHRECLKPDECPEVSAGDSARCRAMKRVAERYNGGTMSEALSTAIEKHRIDDFLKRQEELAQQDAAKALGDEDASSSAEQLQDNGGSDASLPIWRCPWHKCSAAGCSQTAFKGCAKCPVSYCHSHGNQEGDLIPFGAMFKGKRLERVHTFKSATGTGAKRREQAPPRVCVSHRCL